MGRDAPPGEEVPEQRDSAIWADESLITAERKKAVARVLKDLAPRDREIIRLVFFEDMDRPEICRRLGVDAGYVRVSLHRAKARFEAAFHKAYGKMAMIALLLCNAMLTAFTTFEMSSFRGSGWITSAR